MGSVEYGIEHLHTPLLLILGHQSCGAVKAALDSKHAPEGNIGSIINKIKPAVESARSLAGNDSHALVDLAIRENIKSVKKTLLEKSRIVNDLIREGKLKIATGEYKLETGEVRILDGESSKSIISDVKKTESVSLIYIILIAAGLIIGIIILFSVRKSKKKDLKNTINAQGGTKMKWFYNLKVGVKIMSGFALILLTMALVGYMGISGMKQIDEADTAMYELNTKPLGEIAFTAIEFQRIRVNLRDMIIDRTYEDKMTRKKTIEELNKSIEKEMAVFEKAIKNKEVRETFDKLRKDIDKWNIIVPKIVQLNLENRGEDVFKLMRGEALLIAKDVEGLIHDLFRLKIGLAKSKVDANMALAASLSNINIIVIVVSAFFAIFLGIFITRNITNSVRMGLAFSEKIAVGDFTERIDLDQKDELGMLGKALNSAADNLENLIADIVVSSQNLAQAVEQISSGNQNLSQRTSEQASSLEEIASTVEQATATIKNNADNGMQANKMSEDSSSLSESGNKVVVDAVTSINEVSQSSKKIAEIISVINEISFQTNLLALNAAVEAARAGEQGRGFAVVAGEVRNLAQRSGTAAKEIGSLINDSVDKVEKATNLANKSGEALNEITKSVRNVQKLISEIAAASEEQRQGIDQINTAVVGLDNMTQQNAALVEETASASEEMASQAQAMLAMMEKFKIRTEKRDEASAKLHKEVHLKAAEGGVTVKKSRLDKSGGNGDKLHKRPIVDAKKSDIHTAMNAEGFEEF
jgi:methyl-accepting chemotaxis protein